MFSASDLSEEQIEEIRQWVSEGIQMAGVQKRLKEDFGLNVTYMDTRFLALDLDLQFEVEDVEEVEEAKESVVLGETGSSEEAGVPGEVSATLDQVARPGTVVSGTVTFSDGMKGVWVIDEMGRPSIDPDQAGYQPIEADLISFQEKLREMLDGPL